MKPIIRRAAVLCAVLLAILATLVACGPVDKTDDIAFTYFVPGQIKVFDHGQTVRLQIVAINVGRDLTYSGVLTNLLETPVLVIEQNGKTYRIPASDHTVDGVDAEGTWAKGEQVSLAFHFLIPADAPVGHYDLEVGFSDARETFTDAIEVHIHTEGSTHTPAPDVDDDHGHVH